MHDHTIIHTRIGAVLDLFFERESKVPLIWNSTTILLLLRFSLATRPQGKGA